MKKTITLLTFLAFNLTLTSCWMYSFSGGNVGNAKTIQIDFFRNEASYVEPGISQRFTQELQELFLRQTNLTAVNSNGDLHFSGQITEYRVEPISGTAEQVAAKNRLTIVVNVIFENKLNEKDNFEKEFFFNSDYPGSEQLTGGVLENALKTIFERIHQDIFKESVAKW